MTTVAYFPLHYGAEFLDISIKSIRDHVSKIFILYTSNPTYGHGTEYKCPENESSLKTIAERAAPGKISWHNVTHLKFNGEGSHRNYVYKLLSANVTQMICIDADEIWEPSLVTKALQDAKKLNTRNVRVHGFVHFWKSVHYACTDHFAPIRIVNVKVKSGEGSINSKIYHFGYCQSHPIMEYKWLIHGHKNELKKGWRNMYLNWNPENGYCHDVHPCVNGLWDPQPFDISTLPDLIKNHPIYSMNYYQKPGKSILKKKIVIQKTMTNKGVKRVIRKGRRALRRK